VIYEGPGVIHEHFVKMEYLDEIDRKYNPKTILEIGSGIKSKSAGVESLVFLKEQKTVIFVDKNLNNLKMARKINQMFYRSKRIDLIRASPTNLPFRSNCFDLVFSSCVLDFADSPKLTLKEIVRIANGLVLLFSTNCLHVAHFLHKFLHFIISAPWEKAKNLMNFWSLRRVIEEEGIRVIEGGGIDMPPILSCWIKQGGSDGKNKLRIINPRKNPLMFKLLSMFYLFEKSMPRAIKTLQAHMIFILAQKIS
jgi:ubiquinone/menaquinone biosynthesis C-methylase UbiE